MNEKNALKVYIFIALENSDTGRFRHRVLLLLSKNRLDTDNNIDFYAE